MTVDDPPAATVIYFPIQLGGSPHDRRAFCVCAAGRTRRPRGAGRCARSSPSWRFLTIMLDV